VNENIIKQILVQFQEKRDRAQRGKESRIRELYTRVPEIKMLDDEIRQTGILLSKAIIQDPEHAEEKLCEIKSTMKELRQQRAILLTDNNIPKDYTDPHFECSKCKDTGFSANGEKCSCLKQAIISHAYEMSNIAYQLKSENFSTFNVNLFPNEPFKEETLTPRQNMMQIMTLVEDFIQNFDKKNGDNLLFYGDTGLGKTFMCNCIAKDLMDKGHVVLYQTSFKMLEVLKEYKFSDYRSRSASLALQYKLIFESDLLIIDDLGTEMPNSFTVSELFNIINSRMISGKKVLISTNLSPSGLSKTYTSRIFSRILKNFKKLNFYGEDLRKK
jgi:DNA replication protein DnaC